MAPRFEMSCEIIWNVYALENCFFSFISHYFLICCCVLVCRYGYTCGKRTRFHESTKRLLNMKNSCNVYKGKRASNTHNMLEALPDYGQIMCTICAATKKLIHIASRQDKQNLYCATVNISLQMAIAKCFNIHSESSINKWKPQFGANLMHFTHSLIYLSSIHQHVLAWYLNGFTEYSFIYWILNGWIENCCGNVGSPVQP